MAKMQLPTNHALQSPDAVKAVSSVVSLYASLQKEFYKQAADKNVQFAATGKPVREYASLKADQAKFETAFYARQEAQRRIDNPQAAPIQAPEGLKPTEAQINKLVETIKAERAHLAEPALKTGNTNVFNPPPKLGKH
ncbi:MAG: hypothetical protein ABSF18_01905 [Gammaproteobacteria bacterium]|jgi:hypothetical protein